MEYEARLVAVEPQEGPLSIMHFLTVGRGGVLPNGAEWIDQADGWWRRPATDALIFEQIVRAWNGHGKPTPRRYVVMPEGFEAPTDREYRNAWCIIENENGFSIGHDMAKARDLHRAKLREARAPIMAALDVDYMRALEDKKAPGDIAAITQKKQLLRDVTKDAAIDAAQTIDELKAVTLGLL